MRTNSILAGLAVMLLTAWTLDAQEAPAKPRVGDWLIMKSSNGTVIKHTLIAMDETTATIKYEGSIGGTPQSRMEEKVTLIELSDPIKFASRTRALDLNVEKVKSGKEALTVKGAKVNCDWVEIRRMVSDKGETFTMTQKFWTSRDVPISGMVKVEAEFTLKNEKTTTELVDYGRGK